MDREVLLIDSQGNKRGIMPKAEAQRIADFQDMDLVRMSEARNGNVAVCKIMNYGKYKFEMQKKEKDAKKTQKIVETKEIKLSQTIDVGDVNTKAKHARTFIEEGNKVKVSLRMAGRQNAHPEVSMEVLNKFYEMVKDIAAVERKPLTEGKIMHMIIVPIKK